VHFSYTDKSTKNTNISKPEERKRKVERKTKKCIITEGDWETKPGEINGRHWYNIHKHSKGKVKAEKGSNDDLNFTR
jgi:hypothetical protein